MKSSIIGYFKEDNNHDLLIKMDEILDKLRIFASDGLDSFVLEDKNGLGIPNEVSSFFDEFMKILFSQFNNLEQERFFTDVFERQGEKLFWETVKEICANVDMQLKDTAFLHKIPSEKFMEILELVFKRHILYKNTVKSDFGLEAKEIIIVIKILSFASNSILEEFEDENTFINSLKSNFNFDETIGQFIWELFQKNKDNIRYQKLMDKLNNTNKLIDKFLSIIESARDNTVEE